MTKRYALVSRFQSKSDPTKFYEVKIDEEGNLGCSCPAWRFMRGGKRTCRHVIEAEKMLKQQGMNPRRKPLAPRIYYVRCKRCGKLIAASAWSLTHPLGQICSKCITPEEEQQILEYQSGEIMERTRKSKNPKRPRVPISHQLESMIKAEDEVTIKYWLDRIHKSRDQVERMNVLRELIRVTKKGKDSIDIVREVIRRGHLQLEVEAMVKHKLLNPRRRRYMVDGRLKLEVADRVKLTKRAREGVLKNTGIKIAPTDLWNVEKIQYDISERKFGVVIVSSGQKLYMYASDLIYYDSPKKTPVGLYEAFHGTKPTVRKIKYQPPNPKEPLIKVGRIRRIEYEPEPPSKLKNIRFYHEMGDTGSKVLESNVILATDKKGKNLYILRDKKSKHPFFSSRGIIG